MTTAAKARTRIAMASEYQDTPALAYAKSIASRQEQSLNKAIDQGQFQHQFYLAASSFPCPEKLHTKSALLALKQLYTARGFKVRVDTEYEPSLLSRSERISMYLVTVSWHNDTSWLSELWRKIKAALEL